MEVLVRKVSEEHGWLGNMSPHPIKVGDLVFPTSEALFQSLRFEDPEIIEVIRTQTSPMTAKMMAKKHKSEIVVEQMGEEDLDNMRLCLRLKLKQHPKLMKKLLATGDEQIIEDCTNRARGSGMFWGMAFKDGVWVGENRLGKLWMEMRSELKAKLQAA